MRFSSGITRRANSVLSTSMPGAAEIGAAIDEVERRSAERWLAPTFQLWQPASEGSPESTAAGAVGSSPVDDGTAGFFAGQQRLAALLEERGYRSMAPTRVLWMGREAIPKDTAWDPRITVSETLSDTWLDAHMGQSAGGIDPASRMVYRRLLTARSSRFYSYLADDGTIAAIAKTSLVRDGDTGEKFGGIYAMRVRDDHKGRGLIHGIMDAIFHHGVRMDLAGCWIQIEDRSERALGLSAELGFTTAARYRYLTRPA